MQVFFSAKLGAACHILPHPSSDLILSVKYFNKKITIFIISKLKLQALNLVV